MPPTVKLKTSLELSNWRRPRKDSIPNGDNDFMLESPLKKLEWPLVGYPLDEATRVSLSLSFTNQARDGRGAGAEAEVWQGARCQEAPPREVQPRGAPTEGASALGGVAVFKDVWGWLVKAGWTSKRPSSKSLDSRYKYVRPGGRHDGNEGDDYLLGELAVLRYVEIMRVIEVAAEQANPSTSEGEVAGVGRAVGQAVVIARREYGTSEQEARSTSRAAGAVADGSEALGNTAAGVVAVAGARERNKRGDRAELNALRAAASTFGTDERGTGEVGEVGAGGSGHVDQEVVVERGAQGHGREGVVHEDVVPVVAVRVGRRHELQTLQVRLAFKVARGIWRD
ncbi:hypothetical protein GQ600_25553 [Phytophthora cactorum]|nr:hypothetical protein GQ600_25553 [Phytophthora cactorum]